MERVRRKSPQLIRDPIITFGGGEHRADAGETHRTAVHIKPLKRSWMWEKGSDDQSWDGGGKKTELCPGGPLNSRKWQLSATVIPATGIWINHPCNSGSPRLLIRLARLYSIPSQGARTHMPQGNYWALLLQSPRSPCALQWRPPYSLDRQTACPDLVPELLPLPQHPLLPGQVPSSC